MPRWLRAGAALALLGAAGFYVARRTDEGLAEPVALAREGPTGDDGAGAPTTPPALARSQPSAVAPTSTRSALDDAPPRTTRSSGGTRAVVGRVVEAGGGAPVADASVFLTTRTAAKARAEHRASTAADGRFAIELEAPARGNLDLRVHAPGGRGARALHGFAGLAWPEPDAEGVLDVGDVELAPSDTLRVLVVDGDGHPLEGAHVQPLLPKTELREPTDAAGRCTLFVPAGRCPALRVTAAGHGTVVADVAQPPPAEIRVVLARAGGLVVRVVAPSAQATEHLELELSSERPLFPETGTWSPPKLRRDLQTAWFSSSLRGPWGLCSFTLADDAVVTVDAVVTGEPIVVRIVGQLAEPLVEETLRPLAPGERREHVLHLHRLPRAVGGRVLDETGSPLGGAIVWLEGPRRGGMGAETDSEGHFVFEGLAAEVVDLWIERDGFATLGVEAWEVPQDPAPLVFRLCRERLLTVLLRDELGAPILGRTRIIARVPRHPCSFDGEEEEPGVWRVPGLPHGEVELVIRGSGREWRRTVPAAVTRVEHVLPVPGSLALSWQRPRPLDPDVDERILLRSRETGGRALALSIRHRPADARLVPGLQAGDYELLIEEVRPVLTDRGRDVERREVLAPRVVTIVAGATTEARLER